MMNLRLALMFAAAGVVTVASLSKDALASDAPAQPEVALQQPQLTLRETRTKAQKRTRKVREVSGIVLDSKLVVLRGIEERNRVVLLKTTEGDRRLVVDLGPQSGLSELDLKKGQKLAAQGIVARIEDAQIFVANRVRQSDKTLEIARVAQLAQSKPTPHATFTEIAEFGVIEAGPLPLITPTKDKSQRDKTPGRDKPSSKPPKSSKPPPSPKPPNRKTPTNKKPTTEKPVNATPESAVLVKPFPEKLDPKASSPEKPSADKPGEDKPASDKAGEAKAPGANTDQSAPEKSSEKVDEAAEKPSDEPKAPAPAEKSGEDKAASDDKSAEKDDKPAPESDKH